MVAVPAAALSRNVVARMLWSAYPLCVFFEIDSVLPARAIVERICG